MSKTTTFDKLGINGNYNEDFKYEYVNVFKNPNKLPINQIHLEKIWYELRTDLPKEIDIFELTDAELAKKCCDKRVDIIPALDRQWLPKLIMYNFEAYLFTLTPEENQSFITNNLQFLQSLDYLLNCNFHQFWCTILFEPTAAECLRSFLLNPLPWYQVAYLEHEYVNVYHTVFNKFLLVYDRLLTFKCSPSEHMSHDYGIKILIENKLLNLPIVITVAFLYRTSNLVFVNKLTSYYFDNTSQLEFQIKEVEEMINQSVMIVEMVGGHICGFDAEAVIVPISIDKRPPIFSLSWIYSVVNYLLNTVAMLNILFQFHKPSVEFALNKDLPYRLPFTYSNIYRELYEMLDNRDELVVEKTLSDRIFDEINIGRAEFIEVYQHFITYCLDKALENMSDSKEQEHIVEVYIKLLSTALEDDFFICDYDMKYNVASQNEMFESCCQLDTTRTQFITTCIQKLTRHKRLEQLSKYNRMTIEDAFKRFKPFVEVKNEIEPQPGPSVVVEETDETLTESAIKNIVDMFPHLGDGFVLKCLEAYNFNSSDVINAILEENLPPHLYDIPFDQIRIPQEPEPEKPVLAYKGKKPDYNDALKLLDDKSDFKELKAFVLEGVQYTNNYMYDDEYDDRYDNDVAINVGDNPVMAEEIPTFNPNHEDLASDTSYSSEDEYNGNGKMGNRAESSGRPGDRSKMPFCEDPAVIRARREAKFRSRQPSTAAAALPQQPKKDVVGKAKGQGQEKSVLQNRQKKNVQKSSRANHNRKGGAQWKRNKGMVPS